jgi:hypothetical protein
LLLSRFSSFLLGRTLFFFFCMIGLFCITLSRARTYQFSPRLYCFFFFVFLLMQDLNFLIGLCHLAPSFRFIILWVSFGHSHLEISSYHYRMSPRGVDGNFCFVCLLGWLLESLPSIWFRVTKKPRCTDLVRNSQAING